MSLRPVKRVVQAKPTLEGAGVHLRRAFGFGDTSDFDPAQSIITIRAENTKFRRGRVVPYSAATAELFTAYLARRRDLTRARDGVTLRDTDPWA